MSNLISIIVTKRLREDANITLDSLAKQTFQDFTITISEDSGGKGANWTRNKGFYLAPKAKYVLFSDNDIQWEPNALANLFYCLEENPEASYCYGSYMVDNHIHCDRDFDEGSLKIRNYISTMTLIRYNDFPCFDEKINKLQDWDLWLTMLEQGKKGISCGKLIFTTEKKPGITYGNSLSREEAIRIVKLKHGMIQKIPKKRHKEAIIMRFRRITFKKLLDLLFKKLILMRHILKIKV